MREKSAGTQPWTLDQYLSWEQSAQDKHEFVRGEVYAMSGVTRRHDAITLNILACLAPAARNTGCFVNSADVKVRPAKDVIYYPDASVDCVPHRDGDTIVDQPCLVVEVTSPRTARVDRGEKLDNYRRSPSLRMYLVVDHKRKRVTCHQRGGDGSWTFEEFTETGVIALPCPRVDLRLDQIYEGIEMPPLGVAEPRLDDDSEEYFVER